MNTLGNKQDIIKYLDARVKGYGIKEANEYFYSLEVIIYYFIIHHYKLRKILPIFKYFVSFL